MKLIDADTIVTIQVYDDMLETTDTKKMTIADAIDEWSDEGCPPTVDAVEVVRCKDCRWGREVCGNIECNVDMNVPTEYHGYDWYCPNGESKDGGDGK